MSVKSDKVNKILEIPREVLGHTPKITIIGFDEVIIENFKGILEYEDFYAKISTYIGSVNINGYDLKLTQITEDDVLVCGKIKSLDFEREIRV